MRKILAIVVIVLCYVGVGRLVGALAIEYRSFSTFSPAVGVGLAGLLLAGPGAWPAIFIGGFWLSRTYGTPPYGALLLAFSRLIEALTEYYLLRRAFDFRNAMSRVRDVVALVSASITGAAIAAPIAALGLFTNLSRTALIQPHRAPWHFWIGDTMGILIVTPFALAWFSGGRRRPWRGRPETGLILGGLLLVSAVAFNGSAQEPIYLVFPFLIWAALRCGPRSTTLGILIVCGTALLRTLQGRGPFIRLDGGSSLLSAQAFMATLTSTILILAASIRERRDAEAERAQALSREAALQEQRRAQRRFGILADASGILAKSLDFDSTLRNIASMVVQELADYCSLVLLDRDGKIVAPAGAQRDPTKERLLARHRELLASIGPGHPIARVLKSGSPLLVPQVSRSWLEEIAASREDFEIFLQLEPSSFMLVPLRSRNRILGVLALVRNGNQSPFNDEDFNFSQELAQRCALAIENARLYAEARAAIKSRDEFISVASHELRTPITSIRALIQLIPRQLARIDHPGIGPILQAFEIVDKQSEKLVRLIMQLLDISRIEGGKLSIEPRSADIGALIRDRVAIARVQAPQHRFEVKVPESVQAEIDPIRIEQVIGNLLDNAVKYSPQGGLVEIELTRPKNDIVRISVRDHGIGIPPESLANLFSRYYQAHSNLRMSGMGLGLYVSRQIVELHRGRIEVETPSDGGTRFVVTLPTRLAQEQELRKAAAA